LLTVIIVSFANMRYISNYCKQELENQRIVRLAADDRLAKNVVRRQKLRMQFKEAKEAKQAREMYEAAMTAAAAEEAKRCVAEQVAVEAERVQLAALAAAEENARTEMSHVESCQREIEQQVVNIHAMSLADAETRHMEEVRLTVEHAEEARLVLELAAVMPHSYPILPQNKSLAITRSMSPVHPSHLNLEFNEDMVDVLRSNADNWAEESETFETYLPKVEEIDRAITESERLEVSAALMMDGDPRSTNRTLGIDTQEANLESYFGLDPAAHQYMESPGVMAFSRPEEEEEEEERAIVDDTLNNPRLSQGESETAPQPAYHPVYAVNPLELFRISDASGEWHTNSTGAAKKTSSAGVGSATRVKARFVGTKESPAATATAAAAAGAPGTAYRQGNADVPAWLARWQSQGTDSSSRLDDDGENDALVRQLRVEMALGLPHVQGVPEFLLPLSMDELRALGINRKVSEAHVKRISSEGLR
jgi:hypothetical protein